MRPSRRRPLRATVILATILLLVGAPALHAAPADRLEIRALLADALYLESGMGDLRGSLAIYQDIARGDDVPPDLAAEALLRQGLAHEALGEPDQAEAAWLRLMELHPGGSRAGDARFHLDRLEQEHKRIRSLPARLGFDRDVGSLFHGGSRSDRGQLDQELLEVDGVLDGVAAWRTWVVGGEEDLVAVGFDAGLRLQGEVELEVRSSGFPAHLVVELVDAAGRSYSSTTFVVTPDQGWVRIQLTAEDLRDGDRTWSPGDGAAHLEIHDITGRRSTDRGENLVLLDDLVAR